MTFLKRIKKIKKGQPRTYIDMRGVNSTSQDEPSGQKTRADIQYEQFFK